MNNIYEWLYDYYAEPQLKKLSEMQTQKAQPLLDTIPAEQKILCLDTIDTLCMNWGTASFELGVRLGMKLTSSENSTRSAG